MPGPRLSGNRNQSSRILMHLRQTRRPASRPSAVSSASHGASSDLRGPSSNESVNVKSAFKARRSTLPTFIQNIGNSPDRTRSLANYARLAGQYDRSVHRILRLRFETIHSLDLKPGESVLDVACGTGDTLLELARRVSPGGRVVGVEQSEEMAAIASAKVRQSEFGGLIDIHVCPVEELLGSSLFDAVFMSFTHDVLQNPRAVDRLSELARPEARIAIAGMRFLPWWWAAPVNLFTAFRARKYLTTFRGLRKPWSLLVPYAPNLQIQQTYLVGTCYRGFGNLAKRSERPNPKNEGIARSQIHT